MDFFWTKTGRRREVGEEESKGEVRGGEEGGGEDGAGSGEDGRDERGGISEANEGVEVEEEDDASGGGGESGTAIAGRGGEKTVTLVCQGRCRVKRQRRDDCTGR